MSFWVPVPMTCAICAHPQISTYEPLHTTQLECAACGHMNMAPVLYLDADTTDTSDVDFHWGPAQQIIIFPMPVTRALRELSYWVNWSRG